MEEIVEKYLKTFVWKAIDLGLLREMDRVYCLNRLMDRLALDGLSDRVKSFQNREKYRLKDLAEFLIENAKKRGLLEDSQVEADILLGQLMDSVMDRPSLIDETFWQLYREDPKKATDWFYDFSQTVDYIKTDRIAQNISYKHQSKYGEIDLTINLSKPEKDPKKIAELQKIKSMDYPKCPLCIENEGFRGNAGHAPRANHRVIRLKVLEEDWGFQYSPYSYFNEHCIFLSQTHHPMLVNGRCLAKLLSIVEQMPHYFVGSNAGLPIVGGSILSHDHYQGGRYHFAMEKAKVLKSYTWPNYPEVSVEQLYWPLSVVRLRSVHKEQLLEASEKVMTDWSNYSDPSQHIFSKTDGVDHNAITPIVRKKGEAFEMDLVLRNNLTTSEFPDGYFHPHPDVQHIKKENIGLIEVMGLAVLPARLKREIKALTKALYQGTEEVDAKHLNWLKDLKASYQPESLEEAEAIVKNSMGDIFIRVLEDAGVFKQTNEGQLAMQEFVESLGAHLLDLDQETDEEAI